MIIHVNRLIYITQNRHKCYLVKLVFRMKHCIHYVFKLLLLLLLSKYVLKIIQFYELHLEKYFHVQGKFSSLILF